MFREARKTVIQSKIKKEKKNVEKLSDKVSEKVWKIEDWKEVLEKEYGEKNNDGFVRRGDETD